MSARVWCAGAALLLGCGSPAASQESALRVGLGVTHTAHDEISSQNRRAGMGFAGVVRWSGTKLSVEGAYSRRSLTPSVDPALEDFTSAETSLRASYLVWQTLAAEVGFSSRSIDPEFAAQDAAIVSLGLRYESDLASFARVWVRGAAAPLQWYNGGGSGGIGAEIGFGMHIRPTQAGWGLFAEYDFQRLDRTVNGVDVPIQVGGLKVGLDYAIR